MIYKKRPINHAGLSSDERAALFDFAYFDGHGKHGSNQTGGFLRDFPWNVIVAAKILDRKPQSVVELGAARGYVLKRVQDAGIPGIGLDISKSMILTRVVDPIYQVDLCDTPWPTNDQFDLAISVGFLDRVPEEFLPAIFGELVNHTKRGLHGVDFEPLDYDGTHIPHSELWWKTRMPAGHEIVSRDFLRSGTMPEDVMKGDGKVKLSIGTFMTMTYYGWENLDLPDLREFAKSEGYRFRQCDIRQGLPYQTGTVDAISCMHVLEHLKASEARSAFKEMRRVIKPTGAMRLAVPNARVIAEAYLQGKLNEFDEVNAGCARVEQPTEKLWELLVEGHLNCFDDNSFSDAIREAGFRPLPSSFRGINTDPQALEIREQIRRETIEMPYGSLSLFFEAVPMLG